MRKNARTKRNEVDKETQTQAQLLESTGGLTTRPVGHSVPSPSVPWVLCERCSGTGYIVVKDRGDDLAVECVTCHGGRLVSKKG